MKTPRVGLLLVRDFDGQPAAQLVNEGIAAMRRKCLGDAVSVTLSGDWQEQNKDLSGLPVSQDTGLPAGHVIVWSDQDELPTLTHVFLEAEDEESED